MIKLNRLLLKRIAEKLWRYSQIIDKLERRQPHRGRKDIVGRLAHIHVIVGMNDRVVALLTPQELDRSIGKHFIRIHVVRCSSARLERIDDKLIAQSPREYLIGSRFDCLSET